MNNIYLEIEKRSFFLISFRACRVITGTLCCTGGFVVCSHHPPRIRKTIAQATDVSTEGIGSGLVPYPQNDLVAPKKDL